MENTVHYTYRFRGRVQGVGFRFTSAHIAKNFAVAGLVRKELDGSVHLEVEGDRADVKAYISRLESEMSENISSSEKTEGKPKGYQGFVIER